MYRLAIFYNDNTTDGLNFDDMDKLYDYLLPLLDKIKRYRIMDKLTMQLIETEKGKIC